MGRMVWVPVVSGPLAQYAVGFSSWLASRAYSSSAAADRLYQFDQLSRWLAREGLGVGELTGEQAERFAVARRAAGLVSWSSPKSVALPLEYLRQLGVAPTPTPDSPEGPALLEAESVPQFWTRPPEFLLPRGFYECWCAIAQILPSRGVE